ncbi:GNAT family N-acetyltransferase [Latilactobacillus sakei]
MKELRGKDVKSCSISSFLYKGAIDNFNCEVDVIDTFLHDEAVYFDEKHRKATTIYYQNISDDKFDEPPVDVIGFYTLSAGLLRVKPKDSGIYKPIAKPGTMYNELEFPCITLDFLAVDKDYKNQKVAKAMLMRLFKSLLSIRVQEGLGFTALYLNALSDAVDFYERMGFEYLTDYEEQIDKKSYKMVISVEAMSKIVY